VAYGAGEFSSPSVDRDGTQSGFDVALTAAVSRAVTVPVIASGGAKSPEHFVEIFQEGAADAALAASIFHDSAQSIRAPKGIPRRSRRRGAFAMLIPCIDLQGGQAVQLVHGRMRELVVADVFGLLKNSRNIPGCTSSTSMLPLEKVRTTHSCASSASVRETISA